MLMLSELLISKKKTKQLFFPSETENVRYFILIYFFITFMAHFNRNLVSNGTNWVNCLVLPIQNMDEFFFFWKQHLPGKEEKPLLLRVDG